MKKKQKQISRKIGLCEPSSKSVQKKKQKKHSTQTYCGTFQACKRSPGCLPVSFKVLLSGHKVVVALASL